MAEILVSAVVGVVVEKLFSTALMKFAQSQGIDPDQLEEWKKTLPKIKALLADAGQKQINDETVKLWLNDLQELAYDIEDVLDDIATEVMKQDINRSQASTSTSTRSKLLKMLPTCCTNCTPSKLIFNSKLAALTSKMKYLYDQKQGLGLVELNISNNNKSFGKVGSNRITTSSVNVSKVLGREEDKEALIGQLLLGNEETCSNQNVISTVSVVGMGGLGKTTLAQLLYNDERVKDHFKLRAWVCVSEEFNVVDISKQIYQAVGGEDRQFANLDLLHAALKEKLSKKRFLVVLDDVWNEDHKKWDLLRSAFDVGGHGSKFLVTTRKKEVALVMDSLQPYMLEVLSDEISLSLFAQSALGEQNFDDHPLKLIAQSIVKKCDGLPLALIALGRVLKTKGNEAEEWEKLLNSDIWKLEDKRGILPALKLSYYDLPSHLKQLFAYCSLFPKDYVFKKKKLVLLWMAQGFLSQTNGINQPMESLGGEYFEELLSRSFFQPTSYESRYIMHDLMNDLATSVAGEFSFRLDENMDLNGSNEAYKKFRHFSFIYQQRVAEYKNFKELHRARCLRTFLSVSVGSGDFNTLDNVIPELLPHLHSLRVLSLTRYFITEVPRSIGYLKHLRYLNFSGTGIRQIPEEFSKLYNLQSLLVRRCRRLSSLPVSFVKLINLRHLDMRYTPSLKKLPLGIGGLTSLQTLSKVVVEGGNGFKVSELKGLMDLQGELSIEGLEKVIEPTEAKDANLQQKKGLDDLELIWSDVLDDSRDPGIEYEVLERLRAPHSNLRKLKITGYGGMKFPNWIGNPTSFDRLSELMLRGCENCTHLPTLGHLSSLRKLCLSSMKAVQTVAFELLVPTKPFHGNLFPSLESLEVHDMQSLEIWSTCGGDNGGTPQSFPSLRVISIKRCPKLDKVSFGLIPSLQDLNVEECPEGVFRDLVVVSSSIRTLKLGSIKGLTQLDREVLKHLGAVEDLSIWDCDELKYLWESESEACRFLGSLQKLEKWNCSKLVSIKGEKEVVKVGSSIMGSLREVTLSGCDSLESYCCPNSVERLEILNCDSMTSLSFSKLQEEDLPSSSSSSNLKSLWIRYCKNIKSISQEHLQSLTSLEVMRIYECPSMEDSFPSCGGLWPPKLKCLEIGGLKKPMLEWGHQNYPSSLVDIELHGRDSGVVSFGIMEDHNNNNTTTSAACFLLPPSLTDLTIKYFEEVESVSEVLQHLPHLQILRIFGCLKLRDVPESTSSLRVIHH